MKESYFRPGSKSLQSNFSVLWGTFRNRRRLLRGRCCSGKAVSHRGGIRGECGKEIANSKDGPQQRGMHRVRIRGLYQARRRFEPGTLRRAECRWLLILMDIDGGEGLLLDPEAVPELTFAHLLVEIHEGHGPKLRERFCNSHTLMNVKAIPRQFSDMASPGLLSLSKSTRGWQ